MMRLRKVCNGLLVAITLLMAVTAQAQTTIFSEDFEEGIGSWTTTSLLGDDTWFLEETDARESMSPNYMVYDAAVAAGAGQNDLLESPVINCSGFETVTLSYDHRYYRPANVAMAFCTVQISSDDGASWDTLAFYAPVSAEGNVSFDISEVAAYQNRVNLRFGYMDFGQAGDFHWCIDNVVVTGIEGDEGTALSEDFENGLPEDWTVTSMLGDDTWFLEETETRGTMAPNYMVYDAAVASAVGQSDLLMSPAIDCSELEDVTLSFNHRYYRPDDAIFVFCTVQVSGNNGTSWDTLAFYAPASAEGFVQVDISEIANYQSEVKVRFGYMDFNRPGDYHWCLDNIRITGVEGSGGGGGSTTEELYSQDFESGLPTDWSVENALGDAGTWFLEETTSRSSMTPNYMVFDASLIDETGQTDYLFSPVLDCSEAGAVILSFDHYYLKPAWTPRPAMMVGITSDDGATWDTVATYGAATVEGRAEIDITSVAAGESQVKVRFDYSDREQWGDFMWCIDNFLIEVGDEPAPANLYISDVTFSPANPQPDEVVSVSVTVENEGASETGPFTLDWFQDASEAPSMGDVGDYTWNAETILPGENQTLEGTISYSANGAYTWYFLLDSQNSVVEEDEDDNIYGPETIEVMSGAPTGLRADVSTLGEVDLDWFPILGVGDGFSENFNVGTTDNMTFNPEEVWTINSGLAVASGSGGDAGQYNSAISTETYGDAFIEQSCVRNAGSLGATICVIVRGSGHWENTGFSGYVFNIASVGYYSIFKYSEDGSTTSLHSWQAHDAVNSGLDATNVVSVIAYGDEFSLYINGIEIITVQDDSYSEGYFGVGTHFSSDDQLNTVSFDYVTVTTDEETLLMHLNQGMAPTNEQIVADGNAKSVNATLAKAAPGRTPAKSLIYDMSGLDELDEFLNYNIYRDDELIGTSSTSSYTDQLNTFGSYVYRVTAAYDEGESLPTNEATVIYSNPDAEILVWNPDPTPSSGMTIANTILNLGYSVYYATELDMETLNNYDKVFINLGMFPNYYPWIYTDSEYEAALISYLEQGGNLYIEAGSNFTRTMPRNLFPYMRVQSIAPGADDLSWVDGEEGTFTEGIHILYPPDDGQEVGHIEPAAGAERIFYNPVDGKGCGVVNNFGYFKTVLLTFQLGDLVDGESPSTISTAVQGILDFFDEDLGIGTVEGTITDSEDTNAPLEGVEIILDDMVVDTTGTDGTYSLPNLVATEHKLCFNKPGYRYITSSVDIVADQTTTHDVSMYIPSGSAPEETIMITVDITPGADSTGSATIELSNTGYGPLDYRTRLNILESPWNSMYRVSSGNGKIEKSKQTNGFDDFTGNRKSLKDESKTFLHSNDAKDGSKVCGPVNIPPRVEQLDELDELMSPLVQYNATAITQNGSLYGAAVTPDGVFVTTFGAPFTIYQMDFHGILLNSYEFPAEGYEITNDLAYDPNTGSFYGVNEIDSCLYRFTPDLSLLVNIGQLNINPNYASVAYDYDNNLFYIGNRDDLLISFDPVTETHEMIALPASITPGTFNNAIDGITYMPSDPDGYTLWLINDPDYDIQMHRYNPATNEWDVDFIEPMATQWPGGMEATDAYRPGHLDLVMLSQSVWDLVDIVEGYPAPFGWMYMEGESLSGEVGVGGTVTLTIEVDVTAEHIGRELDIASGDMAGVELIMSGDGWVGLDPITVIISFEVNDVEDMEIVLTDYALHQNYPNPFNPTTNIRYDLVKQQHVELVLFDILGRHVATLVSGSQPAGSHTVTFDGSRLASGVYFYRIEAGPFKDMRKLILLK